MSNSTILKHLRELEERIKPNDVDIHTLYQWLQELAELNVISSDTMVAVTKIYPTIKNNIAGVDTILRLCTIPELREIAYGD